MKILFKQAIYLILILIGLTSCQGLKDGLEGNKKSKSSEEFLVKKKNPLVLPPDYSKLPSPKNTSKDESTQNFDLKEILEKNSNSSNTSNLPKTNSSFKKSIIEKIKKN